MEFASKLVICACILHNLAIDHGDQGEDLDEAEGSKNVPEAVVERNPGVSQRERKDFDESRREELLRDFFT
jgi:hypothetical protein